MIGNSVYQIDNFAFAHCTGLTSITIPKSVRWFGACVFKGIEFANVVSLSENPEGINGRYSNDRVFEWETFTKAILYVPKGTKEKYMSTDGWKDFLYIKESVSEGITKVEAPVVQIKSDEGIITVRGADDGTQVRIYRSDGKMLGSAVCHKGLVRIATNLRKGSIALVRTGEFTKKIIIK